MRFQFSIWLVPILLFSGCSKSGPEVAPVSGRITVDGQPVEFLNVTFQPDGKSPGVSRTDKDGHYELMYKRGVMGGPVGPVRVTIVLDTELAHRKQNIPARYNTETTLHEEIKPGIDNEFNFDLTTGEKAEK